ncbi:MAG TPA: double-strand break repair helicase AddA [Xanthobacteraceae bacterium]|nr:double-strand break repair helicase AddA [Xanthobacteraceae bacterium]
MMRTAERIDRVIPAELRRLQIEASDPAASAWVAANAGSGKTHVLALRVIRLLLDDVDPAKILCITFTKAAAANMANRVFDELRRWTALDDVALDAAIKRISDIAPNAARRTLARRLFAMALETPGGLKVQTIHAFCTRLLHHFPFEANVAARFSVLDEAAQAQLLSEISLGVLLDAALAPEKALGRALATAIAGTSDQTFKDVIGEAIRKRDAVRAWIDHRGSIEAAISALCGTLGVAADDTIERVESEMTDGPIFPASQWPAAAEFLAQGGKNDQEQARRLLAASAASAPQRAGIYQQVFVTGKLEPRQQILTRSTELANPELAERLYRERERMLGLIERRKAVACRDRTAALITIADAVLSRYQAMKDRRGQLDYDDLIDKALALLGAQRAAWVHYKLDQGVDHVLIDEAQDTSPKQWDIIARLTAEFFAGSGARSIRRTIFAVGDEKQSIFSFQGAAPREFAVMHHAFEELSKAAEHEFRHVRFRHSFRSGPNVLGAVDAVFARPEAFAGLSADAGNTVHESLPDAVPGLVEIWELIKPASKREIEAWDAPFDQLIETSPQVRLATKIAKNVKGWMKQGARAGDVLVLVRQRGPLFEAVIRALKDLQIPVAGADRLVLTEHIAVMDLMVLADALLLPDDDLALATVLKSPLFGFDDADLFELAWKRNSSLRAALRAKAQSNARFAEALAKLERFGEWAQETPFTFYARVLARSGGRKRFLARLGHEADDALDEFLNLALDYERRKTPSLQGFLAWLRAAQTDVKRDMEITRDEVRVMTVHGAKGLEAPIVVIADTTTPPAGPPQRQPRLLSLQGAAAQGPNCLVWAGAKATDTAPVSAARDRARGEAEDEYRRLLYVAMTRAIDRLVICGGEGERARPPGCWWDLVCAALKPLSVEEDDGEGKVWRYRKTPGAAETRVTHLPQPMPIGGRPSWLDVDAPAEPPPVRLLEPAAAYDELTPRPAWASGSGEERDKALARGTLVHRLLQSLPDIPKPARVDAARRYLARSASSFSAEERDMIVAQVGQLLEDPRFSELFAPGSRAEIPIVGRLNGGTLAVSGQVDRLAVTRDAVLIADYKTNRPAPRCLADVPPAYVAQLALYRAVLAELYPDKRIRAALVWTDVPDLMEISEASLDAALISITSA